MHIPFVTTERRSLVVRSRPNPLLHLLALLLLPIAALAQSSVAPAVVASPPPPGTFDLDQMREPNALLRAPWRFRTGDDPHWSQPDFDDSQWSLARTDEIWKNESQRNDGGIAWYRAKIRIPADAPALALYVPEIEASYEIFADGHPIWTQGGLPPNPYPTLPYKQFVRLPPSSTHTSHTLYLAIRVFSNPRWTASRDTGVDTGFAAPIRIGDANLLQVRQQLFD